MVFQYGLDKVRSFIYDFNNGKLWMYIIFPVKKISMEENSHSVRKTMPLTDIRLNRFFKIDFEFY